MAEKRNDLVERYGLEDSKRIMTLGRYSAGYQPL